MVDFLGDSLDEKIRELKNVLHSKKTDQEIMSKALELIEDYEFFLEKEPIGIFDAHGKNWWIHSRIPKVTL
jgi:peptide subunit release factor 1 (eRF1)